jgi:hypothetical protein
MRPASNNQTRAHTQVHTHTHTHARARVTGGWNDRLRSALRLLLLWTHGNMSLLGRTHARACVCVCVRVCVCCLCFTSTITITRGCVPLCSALLCRYCSDSDDDDCVKANNQWKDGPFGEGRRVVPLLARHRAVVALICTVRSDALAGVCWQSTCQRNTLAASAASWLGARLARSYTGTHTDTRTYAHTHTHTHTHAHMHMQNHKHTRAHTNTQTHTCSHTHARTHTARAQTHARTHTRTAAWSNSSSTQAWTLSLRRTR